VKSTDWIFVILILTALFNAVGGVLAWGARLWWGREYGAAKDETIRAKESQIANLNSHIEKLGAAQAEIIRAKEAQIELMKIEIQNLRELTPMKLREYFVSVKQQLEEYNEMLQKELVDNTKRVAELEAGGQAREAEVNQLLDEKAELEYRIEALERLKADGRLRQLTLEDVERDPTTFFDYLKTLSLDDLILLRKSAVEIQESSERIGRRAADILKERKIDHEET
jgi:hypothetical protein